MSNELLASFAPPTAPPISGAGRDSAQTRCYQRWRRENKGASSPACGGADARLAEPVSPRRAEADKARQVRAWGSTNPY